MSTRRTRVLARAILPLVAAVAFASLTVPAAHAADVVTVRDSAGLARALKAARAGQTISLAAGRYSGEFVAAASGTASAPVTLTGPRTAVLTTGSTGSGYALHITGDRWRVVGFSVRTAEKGIVLDGSVGTVLNSLDVGSIGHEGVHFRANSSDGILANSLVHDTGLTKPQFGEGVYIGSAQSNWSGVTGSATTPDRSDRVTVRNNVISNTPAEGVDAKEGTTAGTISSNRFVRTGFSGANSADSAIDLKGNAYSVSGNLVSGTKLDAIQVHTVLAGWGNRARIAGNGVGNGVPGYEVRVQATSVGTVVACEPSAAGAGLTNARCVP
ncbi:hypothetical protein HD599_002136 [Conyzicola lurida]|uniref:Right handed beta helix domain-containing protein n=1 Tax=Conyzicola lurida TaxID=1172621 RepID=A0A841AQE2_9MICO|nr:right-handed parallel beta-helix repeat-containing protein [Conyzicola lurida]MBB5843813.1 hypothetical protein [Conyzicola lurida]